MHSSLADISILGRNLKAPDALAAKSMISNVRGLPAGPSSDKQGVKAQAKPCVDDQPDGSDGSLTDDKSQNSNGEDDALDSDHSDLTGVAQDEDELRERMAQEVCCLDYLKLPVGSPLLQTPGWHNASNSDINLNLDDDVGVDVEMDVEMDVMDADMDVSLDHDADEEVRQRSHYHNL